MDKWYEGNTESRNLDKYRIIERLVLEKTIASEFCRLLIFLLQLYIFVLNLQLFYPSVRVNFVHKSISETLHLQEMPTRPTDMELLEFLQDLNGRLDTMAPNSKEWVGDPQMRKLLPDPVAFTLSSTEQLLTFEQEPELTADFTTLVRTSLIFAPTGGLCIVCRNQEQQPTTNKQMA